MYLINVSYGSRVVNNKTSSFSNDVLFDGDQNTVPSDRYASNDNRVVNNNEVRFDVTMATERKVGICVHKITVIAQFGAVKQCNGT